MPTMEFWGVEVKGGAGYRMPASVDYLMHLSQAALGESKNKAESVTLYVKFGDQQLVLGTLSHQNLPQMSFDLVFEKAFELSHDWKNGTVHFCGYKAQVPTPDYPYEDEIESESEEELVPAAVTENGKPKTEAQNAKSVNDNAAKPDSAKQNVKITEPSKDQKSEDDDDDDDEDESDGEDDSEDENIDEVSMDESSEESSEEDAEETPVKAEVSKDVGKKRSSESVTKTPQAKKAKSATPEKTDGKKGGHTATPHPVKKAGKAAAQTPKSGGQTKCNSCSKTFNSEQALQSHSKAKHGGNMERDGDVDVDVILSFPVSVKNLKSIL
ncbi:hypothetical protein SLE2022_360570 [Rubroshorea leprosula]